MSKNKITILTIKPILTKEEIKEKEGEYFDESHYTKHNKVITTDTDVYGLEEDGTKKLLLKFRKNVIPQSICSDAYNALEKHAKHKNSNRGAAAGKLSLSKLPNHVGEIIKQDKYRVFYKTKNGNVSRDNVSNIAQSNIAGYYDRPDRNNYNKTNKEIKTKTLKKEIPMCRTTQFTKKNVEKWKKTTPLIKEADKLFNLEKAKSGFTGKNDFKDGIKDGIKDGFLGGYLGFPRWGICVDCRQGDFLAMDVHEYHSNTPIEGDGRLSVVCYLRKKMIHCIKK